MEYTNHISISVRQEHTVVAIDDTELFDFLDDFFVDNGLPPESISVEINTNGNQSHNIYFNPSISPEFILKLLDKVPKSEIEHIYTINNKPTQTTTQD